jgi:ATP-binding cassette, subfamily B, bacterial
MASGFQEEKLPDKLNLSVWLKVGKYAFARWPLLLAILLLTLVVSFYDSSFVPTMNAAAIQAASDSYGLITDFSKLTLEATIIFGIHIKLDYWGFLFLQIGMVIVRSIGIFLSFYLVNILSLHIVVSLRRDTFAKIQELPFSYFDTTSSGWLIARMQNDTSTIGDVLSWNFTSILWSVFDLLFALITMYSINWRLSLLVSISVPLMAIFIPIIEKKLLVAHRKARSEYSAFVSWLSEGIAGAKTIKTLAMEESVQEEAGTILDSIKAKRLKAEKINAFFEPVVSMCSSLMIALLLVAGFYWPSFIGIEEASLAATLVLFIGFTQDIYNPLQGLSSTFSEFMATQAGAEKIMQLLETKSDIVDSEQAIAKYGTLLCPKEEAYEPIKGDLIFKDVHFSYKTGPEVIHGLNLDIKEGKSLAIVGETGSGKSTIVNLLCRFYEPTSGSIIVSGKDYRSFTTGYLRSKIGYVQQTPFVFSSSFKDNIAYGSPKATMEEIEKAAKIVGIDGFIKAQKNGYDTILNEGGDMLSQGQKQLVSFARALVRNPEILILDEATSSIDTETEKEVQSALLKLLKGRTSILIAHRLSTIVDCDSIIVLSKGEILEQGSHKELMEKKGAYYSLYMDQFKELSLDGQIDTYQSQIEAKGIKI